MNVKLLADALAPVIADLVKAALAEKMAALESRLAEIAVPVIDQKFADWLKDLPPPKDGTSVTIDDVGPLVEFAVAGRVGPAVDDAVGKAVAGLPAPKDGTSVGIEDVRPMIAAEVEKTLQGWPQPRDGASVTAEDVRPLIQETVAKAVATLPAPKDGVGLAGGLIDRAGDLALTLTDGQVIKLGRVVGDDGGDGLGFDDLEVADDGLHFELRFVRGEVVKTFRLAKPTLADCYRGVWREGAFEKGQAVTWGGSLFIAQADTEAKPETNDDWKLAVKRGRDGKDGVVPADRPAAPVKFK